MARFVVLEHDFPELHWDFMLEDAGFLLTWRLPCFPPAAGQMLPAQELAVHRLFYLDHEGPVSGDRGRVVRRDRGNYEMLEEVREGGARSRLCFSVKGSVLCGIFVLQRLQGTAWQLWREGPRNSLTTDH